MGRYLADGDVRRHQYLSSTHIALEHSKTADSRLFYSFRPSNSIAPGGLLVTS